MTENKTNPKYWTTYDTMLTLVRPQSPAFVVMYAAALGIAFSPNCDETYTIRPHPVCQRKKDV